MTRRLTSFSDLKNKQQPICMLTCYSYPTARQLEAAGVDIALVGDSLGTTLLGYASTQQVTMHDMCSHVGAVKRGSNNMCIIADMPYQSYGTSGQAVSNAQQLCAAGADAVKLEGALPEMIQAIIAAGIDVCAHLGYLPQSAEKPSVVGKDQEAIAQLLSDARAVEAAGAGMLVLELVPDEVSTWLSPQLQIPTIGIGAGAGCDGQVQVLDDLLGISERVFKHARQFAQHREEAIAGIKSYCAAVRERSFPGIDNVSHIDSALISEVEQRS